MIWVAVAWKYRKPIAIAAACVLFVLGVLYVRSVFTDRARLRQENQVLKVQLQDAAEMQAMQSRIAEAIAQIKIRSQVNVSRIESEPKPQFSPPAPGAVALPLVLVPAGVLQDVYSSAAAGRAAPGNAAGGALPAAGSGG